jgi:phage terminase large subunit-like protein
LRGPQHDAAWCDETAAWFDARKGDTLDTSWNNLMLGLRLGESPQCFVTTTPKRVRLIREIMERKSTGITTDTTYANLHNLAASFKEQVVASYEGTRIGRQELMGELLTSVDGALWDLESIDALRVELSR